MLLIAKNHNLFSEADKYMRQFARVCHGLKGRPEIAEKLEEILNAQISIHCKPKLRAINLTKIDDGDFRTVNPGILTRPEFNFLPASSKLNRFQTYHSLREELSRTKELKSILTDLQSDDTLLREKIAYSLEEFTELIKDVDRDTDVYCKDTKISNNLII